MVEQQLEELLGALLMLATGHDPIEGYRAMIDGGMKKSGRRDKNSVDKISAAIILQAYLDKKK